jgi:hypothetical protein
MCVCVCVCVCVSVCVCVCVCERERERERDCMKKGKHKKIINTLMATALSHPSPTASKLR